MKIAIITGASSGLGAEFARQIDKAGLVDALWLIARRENKLIELNKELALPCKIFALDITNRKALSLITEALQKETPEVHYFINNAGFGLNGDFHELCRREQMSMVDLNCTALIAVAYRIIPFMPAQSYLLNTSSVAGFGPLGAFALYGATKSFATNFSVALAVELKEQGISVTTLTPGSVATEFQQRSRGKSDRKKKFFSKKATPENVVKQALLDMHKGKLFSVPGFSTGLIKVIAPILPAYWSARLAYTTIYPKAPKK